MIFQCPACGQRYDIAPARMPSGGTMRCRSCKSPFAPIPADGIRVLLGHESSFLGPLIMDLLGKGEMAPYWGKTGAEVVEVLPKLRPSVVLLDVALPDAYGFEVCNRIRSEKGMETVKIIYLAAVYDRTRYKRRPVGLYGADDYIEKHHIKDDLVPKIRQLVSGLGSSPPPSVTTSAPAPSEARQFRADELAQAGPAVPAGGAELLAKARRFARIIVSDIGLYNQEAIDRGLADGKVLEYLARDIEEGRALFASRFPTAQLEGEDPLEGAMLDFLDRRRAQATGQ